MGCVADDDISLKVGIFCGGGPLSFAVLVSARRRFITGPYYQFRESIPRVVPWTEIVWSRTGSNDLGK